MNDLVGPGNQRIDPDPRLLLFDLDDTLCDYAAARARRLRIAFGLGSVEGEPERDLERMIADSLAVQPHGVDHFPDLFQRHGIITAGAAEAAMAWYQANRFHSLALFDDAADTISRLRRRRPPHGGVEARAIGVVTNGPADVQRAKVDLLRILDLVDFVLISGEFGVWKPDPAIFHEALRLGGAGAADAIFVGDSPEHDMAGARAAGIRTVWMNRAGVAWPGPDEPPDHEVRGLAELAQRLDPEEWPTPAGSP